MRERMQYPLSLVGDQTRIWDPGIAADRGASARSHAPGEQPARHTHARPHLAREVLLVEAPRLLGELDSRAPLGHALCLTLSRGRLGSAASRLLACLLSCTRKLRGLSLDALLAEPQLLRCVAVSACQPQQQRHLSRPSSPTTPRCRGAAATTWFRTVAVFTTVQPPVVAVPPLHSSLDSGLAPSGPI